MICGLSLPKTLPHFHNLRVIYCKMTDAHADAALCKFLKRRRSLADRASRIELHFCETELCPSPALIRAVRDAPITKVSILESDVHALSTRLMLAACTCLETLELYGYGSAGVAAVDLLQLVTACRHVTELHLCESGIDDGGALVEGLTCLTQLQALKLAGGICLDRAGAEILHSRAHFPRLVELELAGGIHLGAAAGGGGGRAHGGGGMDTVEALERIVESRPALRILTVPEDHFPAELDVSSFELPFEATLQARGGGFRFYDPDSLFCD